MIPYTYLIRHTPSKSVYYGCRYAKGCSPNDLWKSYFTSSKHVKDLIDRDGIDSFEIEIRKTFDNIDECRKWESKVLRRLNVVKRVDFINKTSNISIDPEMARLGNYNRSEETKSKQIEIGRKTGKSNLGRIRSEEFRQKVSNGVKSSPNRKGFEKGHVESMNTRLKKSVSKLGKPSNAIGNYQPVCSCVVCFKQLTSSTIKNHFNFHHK